MVVVTFGEVYPSQEGGALRYRFRTLAANYAKIAWGEAYQNRGDAVNACVASCPTGAVVLVRKSTGDPDYSIVVGGGEEGDLTSHADEDLAKTLDEVPK